MLKKLHSKISKNFITKTVKKFVEENFDNYSELEEWNPPDFKQNPKFFSEIEDPEIQKFVQDVHNIWPKLARKMKSEVKANPEFYSIIPVKNGFIIPGGRYREFYYWDSNWIIEGLLISEMYDTVRGMLENLLSLVEQFGFIPNGARIYYLNRSQLPLVTRMAAAYMKATNNITWLENNIKILDKELMFWLNKRTTVVTKDGNKYLLAHYNSKSASPRPESYYEDYHNAEYFPNEEDQRQFYIETKSSAESGVDFTSRFMVDQKGGNTGNLTNLKTRSIIPVDLNSVLCQAFEKMSQFYSIFKDEPNAKFWSQKANQWKEAIEKVFYNEKDGIWYDWNNELQKPRTYFYPSNFAPLWAELYNCSESKRYGRQAVNYFVRSGLMRFQGGIPASLTHSGEQWDYPNAWSLQQDIVIMGLSKSCDGLARNISEVLAKRWVNANKIGYDRTGEMFEKYDCNKVGQPGGGGEYTVQSGFGWTNGVVLKFAKRFFSKKDSSGENR